MQIPPVSPSSIYSQNDPNKDLMKTFYNAWTDWYKAASDSNTPRQEVKNLTDQLVSFLKDHEQQFMFATKNVPEPFATGFKESFSSLYTNTLNDLESWKNHGCKADQATRLSEFVSDIYQWCSKAYS